jgi:hypothetical protein
MRKKDKEGQRRKAAFQCSIRGRFVAEGDYHKILHGMAKALTMGRYDICIK